MFIPPQGFRHAAALLLTRGCRSVPAGASRESVAEALARLARDLAALADDMRAAPESAGWMLAEYSRMVEQMPHDFDRVAANAIAATILARVPARIPIVEPCDLFLVYVPEDRLPVAALLAVELTKRRVSVALSEYEVSSQEQLMAAVQHGLDHHRAGVVLWTAAFERTRWELQLSDTNRLRVLRYVDPEATAALAEWARRLKLM